MKQNRSVAHFAITTPTVLQVKGLCFVYSQRALFTDWSTRVSPGVTLVRGGDGSGKTTLLRLLAGELPARAGRLQIHDVDLDDQPIAYRQQVFWAGPRSRCWKSLLPHSIRRRFAL